MIIKIKRSEKATFNYTKRNKISQKDCKISIVEREPHLKIRIDLDVRKLQVADGQALILEVLDRLLYERIELSTDGSVQTRFLSSEFTPNSTPTFRLKLISTVDAQKGRVISATSYFKPTAENNQVHGSNSFLNYTTRSLEGRIWAIDWTKEGEPEVLVDTKYAKQYSFSDSEAARAYIYTPLVKEIILGILMRHTSYDDLDERSTAARWLMFCEQKLDIAIPEADEGVWGHFESAHDHAEDVAKKFAQTHWAGNKTLLDKFLHS